MKLKVYDLKGKEKETIEAPEVFNSVVRQDILLKVYEAQKLMYSTPYGTMKGAGSNYSASGILKKRRHDWKSTYGKGISRIPRKIMSRNGASFNWIGATAPNTRGGRRAHPAKPEKILYRKINKKELLIAYKTAFAGTIDKDLIKSKYGSDIKSGLVFDEKVLSLKSKEFFSLLKTIYADDYERIIKNKKVRAGKGKMRGRKYKSNAGLLFVISSKESMKRNGIDVVKVKDLKIKDLSPNGFPGRIACFTKNALKEISERFK